MLALLDAFRRRLVGNRNVGQVCLFTLDITGKHEFASLHEIARLWVVSLQVQLITGYGMNNTYVPSNKHA